MTVAAGVPCRVIRKLALRAKSAKKWDAPCRVPLRSDGAPRIGSRGSGKPAAVEVLSEMRNFISHGDAEPRRDAPLPIGTRNAKATGASLPRFNGRSSLFSIAVTTGRDPPLLCASAFSTPLLDTN